MCSVSQLCLTLCDPVDCSLPGDSIQAIFQARILGRVAISCSRGSSWPRDQIHVFCNSYVGRRILYRCTTWETLLLFRNSQMPDSPIINIYHWSFSDFQIKVWYLCSLLQKFLLFSCGGKFKNSKKEIYDWFCMLYYGIWFHYWKYSFPKPRQHRCQMVIKYPFCSWPLSSRVLKHQLYATHSHSFHLKQNKGSWDAHKILLGLWFCSPWYQVLQIRLFGVQFQALWSLSS